VRIQYPKNVTFTCNRCGICCGDTAQKTRHILLLKADAERISTHTKQPTAAFAKETEGKNHYIYEMHKNPETGKCTFLQGYNCSIYAQRPLICRFYPFQLDTIEDGTHKFTATTECPGTTAAEQGSLDRRFFKRLLKLAQIELDSNY